VSVDIALPVAERVIGEACAWIGTPYHHQASLKRVGCDCLGLVRGIWREIYGMEPETPPPYTRDWAEISGHETLRDAAARHMKPVAPDALLPGDLLLFAMVENAPAKHCAILVSESRMVHAIETHPVAEVSFAPFYRAKLKFAFRFPDTIN
jgi:NlpC/P60 family putative phage cell wall peptidase